MTKDDYLRIARESGMTTGLPMYDSVIVKFASAIAALEREECAKVCHDVSVGQDAIKQHSTISYMNGACDCAAAIRNKDSECA
jgi:hypothetical protein